MTTSVQEGISAKELPVTERPTSRHASWDVAVPHAFPYQGSKRALAGDLLRWFPESGVERVIEPFCGSAAVSVAVAARGTGCRFWLNDLNAPLVRLWDEILSRPEELALDYRSLWLRQQDDPKAFFYEMRTEFNETHAPHLLLFLLARIVKGSVRYNGSGVFNQSPDNRREGMRPTLMRRHLTGVSALLAGRTRTSAVDYRDVLARATDGDVIYMDPPYQGTSGTRSHRYVRGVDFDEFVDALAGLNRAGVRYIVSYDGTTGSKVHGRVLPASLRLRRIQMAVGRSSQATLLGRTEITVESLYLSEGLEMWDGSPAKVEPSGQGELSLT